MDIEEKVYSIVNKYNSVSAEIEKDAYLPSVIGIDSLTVIMLISEVEDEFDISFDMSEISTCLKLDNLIKLVESKVKG